MRSLIGKTAMKRVLFLCGIATVFIATYFMILPALTLDQKAASNQPGIVSDERAKGEDAADAKDEDVAAVKGAGAAAAEGADPGSAEESQIHTHTKDCYRKVQVLDQDGNLTGKTKWVLACEKAGAEE